MTEDDDTHYQPWLRNQASGPGEGPTASGAGSNPGRPAPLPTQPARGARTAVPRGGDADARPGASNLSADELLARPIPIPTAAPEVPGLGARLSAWLGSAVQSAAELNRKAAIADRVSRLEIPRRSRALMQATLAMTGAAARRGGTALKVAADATAQAASRAGDAAAPRIKSLADRGKEGLSKGAGQAMSGLDAGARRAGAAVRRVADAAPGLAAIPSLQRGGKADALPESQLDKLLEEERTSQGSASIAVAPADNLPLFTRPPAEAAAARPAEAAPAIPLAPKAEPAASAPPTVDSVSATKAAPAPSPAAPAPAQASALWTRHPALWAAGGAVVAGLAFAAGAHWGGSALDKARTEVIVRDYILDHPEILPQAMERLAAKQTASAVTRLRTRIETPFSGAWAGAADGDVTLTVFTDYACTFCRANVPALERLLREDKRLKIVFRELPVIGPESESAARLALVAARRGLYMPMHRMLFASGNPDSSARASAAARFSLTATSAEMNADAITQELRSNIGLARDLGFNGTPAWVVGNQAMNGLQDYDALKQAIATARGG